MEIGLLGLIIVIALAIYFKKPKEETESSQKLLLQLKKIDKDFIKISGGTRGIDFEPQLLEKPNINEE